MIFQELKNPDMWGLDFLDLALFNRVLAFPLELVWWLLFELLPE
jgi:hypothetical protein